MQTTNKNRLNIGLSRRVLYNVRGAAVSIATNFDTVFKLNYTRHLKLDAITVHRQKHEQATAWEPAIMLSTAIANKNEKHCPGPKAL